MKAAVLLPVLAGHDAVGNDALAMVRLLRARGVDVRVFCDIAVGVDEATQPVAELLDFAGGPNDLVIYHFSVGAPAAINILRRARGFRVVRYHNITPPEFFTAYSEPHATACAAGRAEIGLIARLGCECYLADSEYNLDELIEAGAPAERGAVMAPFHRVEHLVEAEADLGLLDRLNDGARNVLMVGRIAPNKGHVELVDAFAAFVDGWGEPARLVIIGKSDPRLGSYVDAVRERIDRHRLGARIAWLESVNEAQLKSAFLASHAFMTLSQHEGFCVPLIEAMALGVPIVAHDSSAVGETCGDGGIVWPETDPWLYAASLARLAGNAEFRHDLRARALERYRREFAPTVLTERFFTALAPVL